MSANEWEVLIDEGFRQLGDGDGNVSEDDDVGEEVDIAASRQTTLFGAIRETRNYIRLAKEKGKLEGNTSIVKAKMCLDAMKMARHDLYAALFQSTNNLQQSDMDVEHMPAVIEKLRDLEVDETVIANLKARSQVRNFTGALKLTPDQVSVAIDKDMLPKVRIVDYSVALDHGTAIMNKTAKYARLMDLYCDLNPSLSVAVMNPISGKQTIHVAHGEDEWKEAIVPKQVVELMQETVRLEREIITLVPPEAKSDMYTALYGSDSRPVRNPGDIKFDFSLSESEFLEVANQSEFWPDFMKTLKSEDRKLFFEGLLHMSVDDKEGKDISANLASGWVEGQLNTKEAFEQEMAKERDEVVKEASNHSCSKVPKPPNQELIENALSEHQSKAKDVYEETGRPRLTTHLPFSFRCQPNSERRRLAVQKLAKSASLRVLKDDEGASFKYSSLAFGGMDDKGISRTQLEDKEDAIHKEIAELDLEATGEGKPDALQMRVRALHKALKRVKEKDIIINHLLDITMSGDANDKVTEEFIKGNVKISRDKRSGEIIAVKKATPKKSSLLHDLKVRKHEPITPETEELLLTEEEFLSSKGVHSLYMKSGRVIMVNPSDTDSAKAFGDLAGVDKKNKEKAKRELIKSSGLSKEEKVGKVKSLPYWNQQDRTVHSLEHLSHLQKVVTACIEVGCCIGPDGEDPLDKAKDRLDRDEQENEEEMRSLAGSCITPVLSNGSGTDSESSKLSVGSTVKGQSAKDKGEDHFDVTAQFRALVESSRDSPNYREDLECFRRGMAHFGRSHQIVFENLAFISQMASSGHRIVSSLSQGQVLVTYPTESIMKGDSSIPYICVTVVLPGDIYEDMGDTNVMSYDLKCGGQIKVTMGRRVNRQQLMGHTDVYSRYQIACEILEHLRRESKEPAMSPLDLTSLYTYINCVSINSSSMLDNIRYLVELCMADFSFADEYIKDKLMVPVKTNMHMYLYTRMLELLQRLNHSMKNIKMRVPMWDEDGNVDMSAMRVVEGRFESYLFACTYNKPDHLLMEVIVLFFCTPKGLHGKMHNLKSIHDTPLSINEAYCLLMLESMTAHPCLFRHQYSPKVMRVATMMAEDSCTASVEDVRLSFLKNEGPNSPPLSAATLASTRSTLIDVTEQCLSRNVEEGSLDSQSCFSGLSPRAREAVLSRLCMVSEKLRDPRKSAKGRKREWSRQKKKVTDLCEGNRSAIEFVTQALTVNYECGQIYLKPRMQRDKVRSELISTIKNQARLEDTNSPMADKLPRGRWGKDACANYRFFDSSVVLTEVIKGCEEHAERTGGSSHTVSSMALEHIRSRRTTVFGVRPKGQRTQKDREIFVLDLGTKCCLYLGEHFYKQLCSRITAEKISVKGDDKITDMYNQSRMQMTWVKAMLDAESAERKKAIEEGQERQDRSVHCFHMNLDMTKWAPKDNLQKFFWAICYSRYLTVGEKLFYFCMLGTLWEKCMYVDDALILQSMKSCEELGLDHEDCLFYRATDGYKTNLVRVKHTWLQGQLNYLSSFVHVGAMKIMESALVLHYGSGQCSVDINVHSDDNETTISCLTLEPYEEVVRRAWMALLFATVNVCIEVSLKKSYISRQVKQFISIYNIVGEQVHPWVKALMTTVSGLPYLTIADDVSSALSKIAEAGSKGAPRRTLEKCLQVARAHILDIHGIYDRKTGENKLARELNIREELLPVSLGGMHVSDWTTTILCGPSAVDKGIIMKLSSELTGATSEMPPQHNPRADIGEPLTGTTVKDFKTGELKRALRLYLALDGMCYEQLDDEEENSHCKGLNPFRPAKFHARRTGTQIPFKGLTKESMQEMAKEFLKNLPHMQVRKPTNSSDLRNYYICVYSDTKFQDSLAGQSPAILKLCHIQQRNKPAFRLLKTGDVSKLDKPPEGTQEADQAYETSLKDKIDAGLALTFDELIKYIKERMEDTHVDKGGCSMLWSRYCNSDPEFKVSYFVLENHRVGLTHRKQNLVPNKKPSFKHCSEILNSVNDQIMWYMSDSYAVNNAFTLRYPQAADSDWSTLEQMFPRECRMIAHHALLNPNDSRHFLGLMRDRQETKVRAHLRKELEAHIVAKGLDPKKNHSHNPQVTSKVEELKKILNNSLAWADVDYPHDCSGPKEVYAHLRVQGCFVPDWVVEACRSEEANNKGMENFPRDLMRMARSFKQITSRVMFTPAMKVNSVEEIALQLRSTIESTGEYQYVMYLTHRLSHARTKHLLLSDSHCQEWYEQAGDALSVVYETARMAGCSGLQLESLVANMKYCGRPMSDLQRNFQKLPKLVQMRVVVPLYHAFPSSAPRNLIAIGPYTKHWVIPQEVYGRGRFSCRIAGNGFILQADGFDAEIERLDLFCDVDHLPVNSVNEALDELASDLMYGRQRGRKPKVALSRILRMTETSEPRIRDRLVYDVAQNKLTGQRRSGGYMKVDGLKVSSMTQTELIRDICDVRMSPCMRILNYQEKDAIGSVRHRAAPTAELSLLSMEDCIVDGISLKGLMGLPALSCFLERKLNGIDLMSLLRMMKTPGEFTRQHGSIQSRIAVMLCLPDYKDSWLEGCERVTGRTGVIRTKRVSDIVLDHCQACTEVISKRAHGWATKKDAEATLDNVQAHLRKLREKGNLDDEELETLMNLEDKADHLIDDLNYAMELIDTEMPKRDFNISKPIAASTLLLQSRLQHYDALTAKMKERGITLLSDALMNYPEQEQDFVIACESPVELLERMTSDEIRVLREKKKKLRQEKPPVSLKEMLENCNMVPLMQKHNMAVATCLSLMIKSFREDKMKHRKLLKEVYNELLFDSSDIKLCIEGLLSSCDRLTYCLLKCISDRSTCKGWEVTEVDCMNKVIDNMKDPDLAGNPSLRFLQLVTLSLQRKLRGRSEGKDRLTSIDEIKIEAAMGPRAGRRGSTSGKSQKLDTSVDKMLRRFKGNYTKAVKSGAPSTEAAEAAVMDSTRGHWSVTDYTESEVSDKDIAIRSFMKTSSSDETDKLLLAPEEGSMLKPRVSPEAKEHSSPDSNPPMVSFEGFDPDDDDDDDYFDL